MIRLLKVVFLTAVLVMVSQLKDFVSGQQLATRPLLQGYYVFSHESPYLSQFNFFGAYQYCRSIGMSLISFETVEEVDTIAEYLRNSSDGSQYNASLAKFWAGAGANVYAGSTSTNNQLAGRQQLLQGAGGGGGAGAGGVYSSQADGPYSNQDCMELAPGPQFQPASCDRRLQYICESAQYFYVNRRPGVVATAAVAAANARPSHQYSTAARNVSRR
ncbi:unnamed protein product [Notodromas monacha]|uniref:C-type lectin domain-containing protein n=1 Tax=Notodromas monacha TaxID=399045 RepID=A0A7R9BJI7_9CRUS|nr:unnamed protein product [Notodromas monacha]CAG0916376.1 unnamed protein product [Notodromas monacha]